MIFNTTSAELIDRGGVSNLYGVFQKQFLYGIVGCLAGCVVYRLGYRRLLAYSGPVLICMTILLALTLVPGVGQSINGARRWLVIGGFSFQPSESVKLLIPFYYIHWYISQPKPIAFLSFLKMMACFCIPIGLILLEPDHGTTVILFSSLIVLFFLTQIRWIYWALPLALLTVIGGAIAYETPYVRHRLAVYLNPELDLRGKGHQPHQAKIATGSGGLLGRGLGESLQKLNYLPEARNDYIAAIYAEETGFIGALALISLYMSFSFAGFFVSMKAQDRSGFFLAAILTFLVAWQAFLNLGVVSGLLPSKGMTLPFFSQGGSSLIANILSLFVLLDISREFETKKVR